MIVAKNKAISFGTVVSHPDSWTERSGVWIVIIPTIIVNHHGDVRIAAFHLKYESPYRKKVALAKLTRFTPLDKENIVFVHRRVGDCTRPGTNVCISEVTCYRFVMPIEIDARQMAPLACEVGTDSLGWYSIHDKWDLCPRCIITVSDHTCPAWPCLFYLHIFGPAGSNLTV